MFVLQLGLDVKAGEEEALEEDFSGPFTEAISRQEGFASTTLLRPLDGGEYLLSIAFDNQDMQQKWVATELHGRMWPMLETRFSGCTPKAYTTVNRT
jgi:heme-degrading monooxygenase HmoA